MVKNLKMNQNDQIYLINHFAHCHSQGVTQACGVSIYFLVFNGIINKLISQR